MILFKNGLPELRTFFLLLVMLTATSFAPVSAQKVLLQESKEVKEAAIHELDSLMLPGGELQLEASENNVKGEFIMDVTVHDKGKVLSVFMVSSDADDIPMQNRAKDLVRKVEFSFKVPKSKTYKFQYTFRFTP